MSMIDLEVFGLNNGPKIFDIFCKSLAFLHLKRYIHEL